MNYSMQYNFILVSLYETVYTVAFCRQLEDVLDEKSACTVSRFLGSFRALSKSFNTYLQQVTSSTHRNIGGVSVQSACGGFH